MSDPNTQLCNYILEVTFLDDDVQASVKEDRKSPMFNKITRLISVGADVNINNGKLLIHAIKKQDLGLVQVLIKLGANVNINNGIPLRLAARSGLIYIVDELLESGADVNAHCGSEYAITLAASYGFQKTLKSLIKAGADINVKNGYPIRIACKEGWIDILTILINAGADVNSSIHGEYAITLAASRGFTKSVDLLIKAGANVHVLNDYPLRIAHYRGRQDIVDALIKVGAKGKSLKNPHEEIEASVNSQYAPPYTPQQILEKIGMDAPPYTPQQILEKKAVDMNLMAMIEKDMANGSRSSEVKSGIQDLIRDIDDPKFIADSQYAPPYTPQQILKMGMKHNESEKNYQVVEIDDQPMYQLVSKSKWKKTKIVMIVLATSGIQVGLGYLFYGLGIVK
jgi:ankyrin repeat protein